MRSPSAKKFATAQERLKRIESIIDPYVEDLAPQGAPDRGEWIPGDHLNGVDGEPDQPKADREK